MVVVLLVSVENSDVVPSDVPVLTILLVTESVAIDSLVATTDVGTRVEAELSVSVLKVGLDIEDAVGNDVSVPGDNDVLKSVNGSVKDTVAA